MKNVLFVLLSIWLLACDSHKEGNASTDTVATTNAEIKFDNPEHDFGTLTEGDTVSHVFSFTNTGTDPLEILAVNVSCGCTVAENPYIR